MLLNTPYSQILSRMFCVVATNRRKNVNERAIRPITATRTEKIVFAESNDAIIDWLSTTTVKSPTKYGRKPLIMN